MVARNLSLTSLLGMLSGRGFYLLSYSWLFGMSVWVTFFAGTIAHRALPRHQFGVLQHRVFPAYFLTSILLSAGLLGVWTMTHADVVPNILNPLVEDVLQAYLLAIVLFSQVANQFVLGPLTSSTMFQRQKLEKEEGKTYNEPGVSDKMKTLNRRFIKLHGISSLANLAAVICMGLHGLWLGSVGI